MTLGSAFQNAGRPRFFKYTSRCKLVLAVLRFNAKFRALSQCSAPVFLPCGEWRRTGQGQVRHLYTISALVISICGKLRFINCRYGPTDCLARDVKSGGDVEHRKSARQISVPLFRLCRYSGPDIALMTG